MYLINIYIFLLLQIGELKNYYLFSHPHISKRSVNASREYENRLKNDPQVSLFLPITFN